MSGTLISLVSLGQMDAALTGQSQITFWRTVYRRYTNFAMEAYDLTPSGTPRLGQSLKFKFERIGDLVYYVYAKIKMPAVTGGSYVASVGQRLIEKATVSIGGQPVDELFSQWLVAWEELAGAPGKSLEPMVSSTGADDKTLYVPLPFWFTQTSGLALPLVALQFHSVDISLKLAEKDAILVNGEGATAAMGDGLNVSLLITYIYLDQMERQRFAEGAFEVLIHQHQHQSVPVKEDGQVREPLEFNHCVQELIWFIEDKGIASPENSDDSVENVVISFNGNHREDPNHEASYYRLVQPYQHHSKIPDSAVYCYSFALHPEESAPSGSTNFSRIDSATFKCKALVDGELHIMASNYNILRFRFGLGGQKFAN